MRLSNESGQALLETALTVPLLALLFLGMVELSQMTHAAINVSNAAKSAAQYAAQDTNTAVQTANMLIAAQNEVGDVPNMVSALDMPLPATMPDGSALPAGTVCVSSGTSYSCSYCSCSSPDSSQSPFACGSATALQQCAGISHLEQNIILETHVKMRPIMTIPGMTSNFDLYGHAAVKRLAY